MSTTYITTHRPVACIIKTEKEKILCNRTIFNITKNCTKGYISYKGIKYTMYNDVQFWTNDKPDSFTIANCPF